jgi:hypothetical protein
LSDGLCFFEAEPLDEGFSQHVVGQFSTIRTRRRRVALTVSIAVLAAAAALLAILPGFLTRPVPTEVASAKNPTSAGSENESQPSERPQNDASAAGSLDFEHDAIDVQRAHVFWGQWASRLKTDQWAPVDRIAGEFAPITEPLSVAIEEIRSTIPLGRSSRPTEPSSDSVDTWLVPAVRNTA